MSFAAAAALGMSLWLTLTTLHLSRRGIEPTPPFALAWCAGATATIGLWQV